MIHPRLSGKEIDMLIISRIRHAKDGSKCTTYSQGHYRLQGSDESLCGVIPSEGECWVTGYTMGCSSCRMEIDMMVVNMMMESVKI